MIQDIAPRQFHNEYKICTPEAEDFVLAIRKNSVILIRREEDMLRIPTLREIREIFPEAEKEAYYLFSIDDFRYFLVNVDEHREFEIPESGPYCLKDSRFLRNMDPEYEAFAVITGMQLARWRRAHHYCGFCGTPMEDSTEERALVCPKCHQIEYPKISPAIIVAITNGSKLLMTKYRGRPYAGYALVAGFVEIGETFEDTVRREVMEEVGLKVKNIRYYQSQPWAFSDTEMIGFFAELDGDDRITLQEDELAMAGWFEKDEIPDDWRMTSISAKLRMAFKYGEDRIESELAEIQRESEA